MTLVRTLVTAVQRARTAYGSTLLALVLAVLVTVAVQSVLASFIAERAILREAAASGLQHALAVQAQAHGAREPVETLAGRLSDLVASPEVLGARVVDAEGHVVAAAAADLGGGWPTPHAISTGPTAERVGDTVHVSAPLRLDGRGPVALQLLLDGSAMTARTGGLQRRLIAVVLAGGGVTVVLWVLFVGRSAWRRRTRSRPIPGDGSDGHTPRHHGACEPTSGGPVPPARTAFGAAMGGTDDLTGVGDRRSFTTELAEEVAAAGRTARPLSLVLVDLNGVSDVRDARGRRGADALLRAVAALLLARTHRVSRVAGDGFAVLLPGASGSAARGVGEEVATAIAAQAQPLTADVGVAWLDARVAPDAETMLIRAETDPADARERRAVGQRAVGQRAVGQRAVGDAEPVGALDHVPTQPTGESWDVRWLTG